jgi:hypothetical protein
VAREFGDSNPAGARFWQRGKGEQSERTDARLAETIEGRGGHLETKRSWLVFGLNAKMEMAPVMALEDLQQGLSGTEGIVQRYG